MFPPKPLDISSPEGGCSEGLDALTLSPEGGFSEGLDAFRFFLNTLNKIKSQICCILFDIGFKYWGIEVKCAVGCAIYSRIGPTLKHQGESAVKM